MVNSLARALHSNAKYAVAHSYRICALTPKKEAATLTRNREKPSTVTKKKLFVLVRTKNTLSHAQRGKYCQSYEEERSLTVTRKKQLP